MKPAMTPQQERLTSDTGFSLYKEISVGREASIFHLLHYELATFLLSGLPGLAGFGLRALLYPPLFSRCGRRPAIGRGCIVRNPARISIGKGVLIDDYAALDARGDGATIGIGNHVSIGRYSSLVSKGAHVILEDGVNIGSYCRLATQSSLHIGESTLIAAYAYIGPGNHQSGNDEVPLISREMDIRGGVSIGKRCWIGARATILDGVSIGDGSIVGAHSLVRESVPAGVIVAGVPAKIVREIS